MSASAKTPLQDVVSTICDALADLPPDDQVRALEAVRLTLGLDSPQEAPGRALAAPVVETARSPALPEPSPTQPTLWEASLFEPPAERRPLPTVVVQMMGDRPMVMGQQVGRPGRTLVVVGPQRDQRLRQLSAPRVTAEADGDTDAAPVQSPGGGRRGGYVRSIR